METFTTFYVFLIYFFRCIADNAWLFVHEKTARGHHYLYLVESVREGGRVRQQIIRPLGCKDALSASGKVAAG